MRILLLIIVSILPLTLTACGGDDGIPPNNQNSSTEPPKQDNKTNAAKEKICSKLIYYNKKDYTTSDYDKDGDGCLTIEELIKIEQSIKDRSVISENISIVSNDHAQIKLLKLIGSALPQEINDVKHAVLDATQNKGKFTIEVRLNRDLDLKKDEILVVTFSPYESSDIINNNDRLKKYLYFFFGSKNATIECVYNKKSYKCGDNGDINFEADTNNLSALICKASIEVLNGIKQGKPVCSTNHANIKLKLK